MIACVRRWTRRNGNIQRKKSYNDLHPLIRTFHVNHVFPPLPSPRATRNCNTFHLVTVLVAGHQFAPLISHSVLAERASRVRAGARPAGKEVSGLGLCPEDVSYSISLAVACVKDGAIVCTHPAFLHPATNLCNRAFNRPALA